MKHATILLLSLTLAVACGDDDTGPTDTGTDSGTDTAPGVDAPEEDVPMEQELDLSQFQCQWEGPYGVVENATIRPVGTMSEFGLMSCDGSRVRLPDATMCTSRFTIISIAAEWCGPCHNETSQFRDAIIANYDSADVHLVQVLTQDADGNPSTPDLCQRWKSGAALAWGTQFIPEIQRHMLQHEVWIDPAQVLGAFFPTNSLPATIIIDNTGTIRHYETGADAGLNSLRSALDRLLAE